MVTSNFLINSKPSVNCKRVSLFRKMMGMMMMMIIIIVIIIITTIIIISYTFNLLWAFFFMSFGTFFKKMVIHDIKILRRNPLGN